jgi:hypothetical protein
MFTRQKPPRMFAEPPTLGRDVMGWTLTCRYPHNGREFTMVFHQRDLPNDQEECRCTIRRDVGPDCREVEVVPDCVFHQRAALVAASQGRRKAIQEDYNEIIGGKVYSASQAEMNGMPGYACLSLSDYFSCLRIVNRLTETIVETTEGTP